MKIIIKIIIEKYKKLSLKRRLQLWSSGARSQPGGRHLQGLEKGAQGAARAQVMVWRGAMGAAGIGRFPLPRKEDLSTLNTVAGLQMHTCHGDNNVN